jgi:hypothetical protein
LWLFAIGGASLGAGVAIAIATRIGG